MTQKKLWKWREVKAILHKYNVTVGNNPHHKLIRVVNGERKIAIVGGHGKDFDVKACYINHIIAKLEIPKEEFEQH